MNVIIPVTSRISGFKYEYLLEFRLQRLFHDPVLNSFENSRTKNNIFAGYVIMILTGDGGIKTYFLPKRREKKRKRLIKSPARYEPAAQRQQHHQIIQISHEMRSGVLPISPSWSSRCACRLPIIIPSN